MDPYFIFSLGGSIFTVCTEEWRIAFHMRCANLAASCLAQSSSSSLSLQKACHVWIRYTLVPISNTVGFHPRCLFCRTKWSTLAKHASHMLSPILVRAFAKNRRPSCKGLYCIFPLLSSVEFYRHLFVTPYPQKSKTHSIL